MVTFEVLGGAAGLIAAGEVPSALRSISEQGAMGYTVLLFEWILGLGEEFESEPVFYFGCSGEVRATGAGASTPLDLAVEGPYIEFVLHDPLIGQLGDITSRAGFTEMLPDDG